MIYNDLTIVIPIRIESNDRLRNINAVVSYLKRFRELTIIILEADKQPCMPCIDGVEYVFIEDSNSIFHRTKYINNLLNRSKTKFVGVWDSDVIVSEGAMEESLNHLRDDHADMIIPYNGRFLNVPESIVGQFIVDCDFEMLHSQANNLGAIFGRHSCGGAFIVDRNKYLAIGGENEKFVSWGPEDLERYKRWEICEMKVLRVDEPIFHLSHSRGINSTYIDKSRELALLKELINTCRCQKKHFIN